MFIALAVVVGLTSFPGGDANDLAKNLAEATHRDVVICQSFVAPLKAVEYDASDISAMARAVRSKTGIGMAPGVRLAFSDGFIDPTHLASISVAVPVWKHLDGDVVKDGKVTLETSDKERLDPASLASAKFSRPLTVHWLFARLPVSAWVHNMPEQEFLTSLAKSVGGLLVTTPKEYRLDLDPAEFRRRTIERMKTWPEKWIAPQAEPMTFREIRVRFSVLTAGLEAASLGTISDAFKDPKASASYVVTKSSPVVSLFVKAIHDQLTEDPDSGKTGFRTPSGFIAFPDQLEDNVDLRLSAKFGLKVTCHVGEIGGKPGAFSFEFVDG